MTHPAQLPPLPLFDSAMRARAEEEHRLPDPAAITPASTTLAARFEAFHRANPQIYRELANKAEQLLSEGRTRIGIAELVEELRYDHRIGTRGDPFRINNSYRAFYARMLRERIPRLRDVMEVREQIHGRKKNEHTLIETRTTERV